MCSYSCGEAPAEASERSCTSEEVDDQKKQLDEQPKDDATETTHLGERRAENREEMCSFSRGDNDDVDDAVQADSSLVRDYKMSMAYYETYGYPALERDGERDCGKEVIVVDEDSERVAFSRDVRKVQSCPDISKGHAIGGSQNVSKEGEDDDVDSNDEDNHDKDHA